uniref:Secreted protein n=1 Tax=Ditylenchus dipsaci TaxID=166011 RepID=A0A915DH10_9BILA
MYTILILLLFSELRASHACSKTCSSDNDCVLAGCVDYKCIAPAATFANATLSMKAVVGVQIMAQWESAESSDLALSSKPWAGLVDGSYALVTMGGRGRNVVTNCSRGRSLGRSRS